LKNSRNTIRSEGQLRVILHCSKSFAFIALGQVAGEKGRVKDWEKMASNLFKTNMS